MLLVVLFAHSILRWAVLLAAAWAAFSARAGLQRRAGLDRGRPGSPAWCWPRWSTSSCSSACRCGSGSRPTPSPPAAAPTTGPSPTRWPGIAVVALVHVGSVQVAAHARRRRPAGGPPTGSTSPRWSSRCWPFPGRSSAWGARSCRSSAPTRRRPCRPGGPADPGAQRLGLPLHQGGRLHRPLAEAVGQRVERGVERLALPLPVRRGRSPAPPPKSPSWARRFLGVEPRDRHPGEPHRPVEPGPGQVLPDGPVDLAAVVGGAGQRGAAGELLEVGVLHLECHDPAAQPAPPGAAGPPARTGRGAAAGAPPRPGGPARRCPRPRSSGPPRPGPPGAGRRRGRARACGRPASRTAPPAPAPGSGPAPRWWRCPSARSACSVTLPTPHRRETGSGARNGGGGRRAARPRARRASPGRRRSSPPSCSRPPRPRR